jgi:hypothetical protein
MAAEAYYFFLDEKVTKTKRSDLMNATKKQFVNKSSRQKGFLRTGLTLQSGQNHGCCILPRCRSLMPALRQNPLMPFPAHIAIIVLPAFTRSCFVYMENTYNFSRCYQQLTNV